MAASVEDIRRWLKSAPKGTHHMVVVCDTFDYEDYPVYVGEGEDTREVADNFNGKNMQQVMEVYSLTGKHTMESQLVRGTRVHNYD